MRVLLLLLCACTASVLAQSCVAADVKYLLPLQGTPSRTFSVESYVDLDPTAGVLDWNSGSRSYDGCKATEFVMPSFRAVDYDGFQVRAAAAGTVTQVSVSASDRNAVANPSSCSLPDNYITITSSNGYKQTYRHLRTGSAQVSVGDVVTQSQVIALAGAAGCVASPRIGFEVRDCADTIVDPYSASLWLAALPYNVPSNAMELSLVRGAPSSTDSRLNRDRAYPRRWTFAVGDVPSIVYTYSNPGAAASVHVEVERPGLPDYTEDFPAQPACLRCTLVIQPWTGVTSGASAGSGIARVTLNNAILLTQAYEVTSNGKCASMCEFCNQQVTVFQDADGDGYGTANATMLACTPPSGYASTGDDCDDENAAIHPGAEEVCDDGIDNNCSGTIDDGDTCGLSPALVATIVVASVFGVAGVAGAGVLYTRRTAEKRRSDKDEKASLKDVGPENVATGWLSRSRSELKRKTDRPDNKLRSRMRKSSGDAV